MMGPEFLALAAAVAWGSEAILVRRGSRYASVALAALMGFVLSTVVLWGAIWCFLPLSLLYTDATYYFIISGLIQPAIVRFLHYTGIVRLGASPRRPGSQRHSPVRHRHRLQFPRRAARHRGLSGIVPVRPGGLVHLEPAGGRERMEDHSPGVPAGRGVPDGHIAEFPENRATDHAQPLRRHRRHHHHLPGGLFAEPGGHGPATDAKGATASACRSTAARRWCRPRPNCWGTSP